MCTALNLPDRRGELNDSQPHWPQAHFRGLEQVDAISADDQGDIGRVI